MLIWECVDSLRKRSIESALSLQSGKIDQRLGHQEISLSSKRGGGAFGYIGAGKLEARRHDMGLWKAIQKGGLCCKE